MAPLFRLLVLTVVVTNLAVSWISEGAEPTKRKGKPLVDLKTSRIYVLVDKKGLGHQHGVEGQLKSGDITLGSSANAGEIVFDMASFKADTDAARKQVGLKGHTDETTQKKVSDNMLGPNVLDVENHPTATFKIDSAIATGKRSESDHPLYELRGTFELRGATRPLNFVAEAIDGKNATRLRGQFNILQTDYDMKPYTMGFGAVGVADELKIWGEIDINPISEKPGKTP